LVGFVARLNNSPAGDEYTTDYARVVLRSALMCAASMELPNFFCGSTKE
jgi:hypothetical protein